MPVTTVRLQTGPATLVIYGETATATRTVALTAVDPETGVPVIFAAVTR